MLIQGKVYHTPKSTLICLPNTIHPMATLDLERSMPKQFGRSIANINADDTFTHDVVVEEDDY